MIAKNGLFSEEVPKKVWRKVGEAGDLSNPIPHWNVYSIFC
nr:hypothetical protein [uncultured Pedobacter sp.]